MKYAILIYSAESYWDSLGETEREQIIADHGAMQEKMRADGAFLGASRLMDTTTASTLVHRSGGGELIDGPFAETKEQLGGFYLVECEHLDQVIDYAQMISSDKGAIEIRPVMYNVD